MEYKRRVDDIVWVLGIARASRAIVSRRYESHVDHLPVYDVTLLDDGAMEVDPDSGSVTMTGWAQWRLHDKKKGAVMELYSHWAKQHKKMDLILYKSAALFDDPDALEKHLEQIGECYMEDN
jgi:hypothetical protein